MRRMRHSFLNNRRCCISSVMGYGIADKENSLGGSLPDNVFKEVFGSVLSDCEEIR